MTDWIAVDWGTSRMRLWAIAPDGTVTGKASSDDGMGRLLPRDFEPAFLRAAAPLIPPDGALHVLICGMAGARGGWQEAPYAAVPCAPVGTPVQVAATDPRLVVHILPGLSQSDPADVMRGEETQIAGLLATNPEFDGLLCLPGTHSKWVRVSQGQVRAFRTSMTGELFDLISNRSTLASFTGEDWDETAFDAEITRTIDGTYYGANLFSLRAEGLLTGHRPGVARARLSAQLISAEVADMCHLWRGRPVTLLGDSSLARLYAKALAAARIAHICNDAERLTLAGLKSAYARFFEVPA